MYLRSTGMWSRESNRRQPIVKDSLHWSKYNSNFLLGNAQGHRGYPIVYCSDGFCELTGFVRTEVMQKNCSCQFLYGAGTSEHVTQQMQKALEGREEYQTEVQFYRKNGSAFWCLLDIVPIKNEKGEMVLFLFSFKDITDTHGKATHRRDDEKRRRKSSHLSAARKRGRSMLYHFTSHFSRGGKSEVNISTLITSTPPFTFDLGSASTARASDESALR
ncbi:hypothetical protein ACEWY4_025931 [Coilia grayii]|uniref:LOV domain-containing protein n=1 Tax=Coilia grayii TaxID=363190 RepID=A0ABD1IWE0_9TELE